MRKLIQGGLFLASIMIGMTACEKENSPIPVPTKSEVSTDGKMLIFESTEHFEEAVSDLSEGEETAFLDKISHLGYDNYFSVSHDAKATTPEMDPFLGQVLNKDGVVQIGDHLFRIDLERDEVFVLPIERKATSDYADLLKGNTLNENISAYSTGDDVLHLVKNPSEEKCGGISGGTYPCYTYAYQGQIIYTFADGSVWRLNPGVKFFRAGIYYRLSSLYEVWYYPSASARSGGRMKNLAGLVTIEMFCRYPQGWYRKRPCRSSSIGTQPGGFYYSSTQASYQRTFYSGTRNLNGYYFYVQGRGRDFLGNITQATPYGGRNINSPY